MCVGLGGRDVEISFSVVEGSLVGWVGWVWIIYNWEGWVEEIGFSVVSIGVMVMRW